MNPIGFIKLKFEFKQQKQSKYLHHQTDGINKTMIMMKMGRWVLLLLILNTSGIGNKSNLNNNKTFQQQMAFLFVQLT